MGTQRALDLVLVAPLVGAVLAAGGSAGAAVLDYSNMSVIGDQTIQITDPSGAGSGQAGLIELTTTSGTVDAWCIDVFDVLKPSGSLDTTPFPASAPGVPALDSTQVGEMGALVRNGDALVAHPPVGDSAQDVGAAIQIAIWKVEYGPGFSYSWTPTDHPTADTLAGDYYVDAVGGAGSWAPDPAVLMLAPIGGSNQALVAAIPETSTWVMALVGFAALGTARASSARRSLLRIRCGRETGERKT